MQFKIKKVIYWLIIFSILTGYSSLALQKTTSTNMVYAQTVSDFPNLAAREFFIAVDPDERRRTLLQRLIDRLNVRYEQSQELCQISEETFIRLSEISGFEFENISIDNISAQILIPQDQTSGIFSRQISSLPDVHCLRANTYRNIIISLTAHLS